MASRTLPNLQLKGFWALGEDEYKDEMDLNLLKLSVLTQGGALSIVSSLPGSPTNGDVHVLDETAGGNANKVAVRDNDAWVYFTPQEGWLLYVVGESAFYTYDGSLWTVLGISLPEFDPGEDGGKVLQIKLDGSGYEWVDPVGSANTLYPVAAAWRIISDAAGSDGTNVGFGEIQFIDKFGDQIFESGTLDASSEKSGFTADKAIDADFSAGNGWMPDIPTTEDAVGAWWSQTWVAAHEVAGVMLYPIFDDFESAPEEFRVQYYDDDLSDWVDAGTFVTTWEGNSQQYFALEGTEAPPVGEDEVWGFLKDMLVEGPGISFDIDEIERTITIKQAAHTIGFGFGPGPEANEVVFAYVFAEAVQWADEIVGSYGYQGVTTTATYNLTIQKNGVDIGVVQFQNTPSISFGITGSSPIDWAPGDVLTVVGAATPDDTLANVAITFYGTRTA